MELQINRYIQKGRSGGSFNVSVENLSQTNFNRLSNIFVEITERINNFSCSSQTEIFLNNLFEKMTEPLPWEPTDREEKG